MKITVMTALAAATFALAPLAHAGEGNGNPFPNDAEALATVTTSPVARVADVGSEAPINPVGRPGTQLATLSNEVVPGAGSEAPVQTANSLPAGFEVGTVAYAQAQSINRYFAEQARRAASFATASAAPQPRN